MGIQRLENVGIVVEDLEAATAFSVELGLEVLGEEPGGSAAAVQGDWVDHVVGLHDVRVAVAMLQTPDGHGRLEIMRFDSPEMQDGDRNAPANTHGIRRVAFTVDDIDAAVDGLRSGGVELLGDVVRYEDGYVRGPEGIIVMLIEEL